MKQGKKLLRLDIHKIRIKILLGIIILIFLLSSCTALKREENLRCKDCNVIIIGLDALQAKHVGALGYSKDTTPHIDEFSKKAIIFENAISPSSWTFPTFMSIFTSLYPSQHKLLNKYSGYEEENWPLSNFSELSPNVDTLAEVLKGEGYRTAAFTGDAGVSAVYGYDEGFDTFYDRIRFGDFENTMPKALEWLRENENEKFFLFVHGYNIHGHYNISDNFKVSFLDSKYNGKFKGTMEEQVQLRNKSISGEKLNLSQEDVRFWRAWYDTKIYHADKLLGEFIKGIEDLGVSDNTIIILVSDHGTEFYEHGRFDHGFSLYDELIHVPFIIKAPNIDKSIRVNNQVRTLDLMPTLLDILQFNIERKLKQQMQGISLVPLIRGKDLKLNAFSETDYLLTTFKRSIRSNDGWKFIYTLENEEKELYNLNQDPYETNNLIDKETKKAYELEQKLFKHLDKISS